MLTILTEKPSAGRNFANALGGMQGTFNGEEYTIISARGHLLTLLEPSKQVPEEKIDMYRRWQIEALPWVYDDFAWKKTIVKMAGAKRVMEAMQSTFSKSDEVVIATDVDPSGEGELLAVEILQACRWTGKTSRMYFYDESETSIRNAFSERKTIEIERDGDYIKADARSKWDYLSMQWTRIATCIAMECGYKRVLRQGRLKSVMCSLVGQQEDAIANYKKVPFYEVRFKDENGNVFAQAKDEAIRKAAKEELDIGSYSESEIVIDSETRKSTPPGKLLDLAGLSAMLAAKGYKPADVLSVYQKMYEQQVVSYPRTEDKKITPEQFGELLPLTDEIARVVGVDPKLLTHRHMRKTHVDEKAGAHGANRPGPKPPASLAELEKRFGEIACEIYTVLARNYLAMLAEDYEYLQQKGHLKDYPSFSGTANIPLKPGYKEIFDNGTKEDEPTKELGEKAAPFIHEGANKKPEKPTIKWLIKRLEKFNVGTGATRTATIAEITRPDPKMGLMNEKKGVLSLTQTGQMSYTLLQGCNIASAEVTEKLFKTMQDIGNFNSSLEELLRSIDNLLLPDIDTMRKNKQAFLARFGRGTEGFGSADKAQGTFVPTAEEVSFNKMWGKYLFSDEEIEKLLRGEEIAIEYPAGESTCRITGVLKKQEWKEEGRVFWGFYKLSEELPKNKVQGIYKPTGEVVVFKNSYAGHMFSDEEIEALLSGKSLTINCRSKDMTEYTVSGKLGQGEYKGHRYWGFIRDTEEGGSEERVTASFVPPGKKRKVNVSFKRTWGGHRFTDEEVRDLLAGKTITIDYVTKAGIPAQATGSLGKRQYKGNKFWTFKTKR